MNQIKSLARRLLKVTQKQAFDQDWLANIKRNEVMVIKLDWPEDGWADWGREPDPDTPEPEIEIWIPDEPLESDDDNNDDENRE